MGRRTYQRDPFRAGPMRAVTVVEQAAVDLCYDYSTLAEAQRETVRRAALTIKPRLKRAAEDIFVIGKELRATKDLLLHGEYTKWLDIEFGLSERMAQRFVNVFERLGAKTDIMSVLPPTTLYLLAAPSTPDAAIAAVEQQLTDGARISVATVQRAITDAKQQARTPAAAPSTAAREEQSGERMQAARRVAEALSTMLELLNTQTAADWKLLFGADELERVCAELTRLRRTLATTAPNAALNENTNPD